MKAIRPNFVEVDGFVRGFQGELPVIRQWLETYAGDPTRDDALEHAYGQIRASRGAASAVGLRALWRLMSGLELTLEEVRDERRPFDQALGDRIRKTLDDIDLAFAGFRLQADRVTQGRAPRAATTPEDDEVGDLVDIFRLEADEHFQALATLFPELKADPGDRKVLRDIQRRAHTLKGAAGTAGLNEASAVAHRMEDLFDVLVEGRLSAEASTVDLILRTTDALQALIYDDQETHDLDEILRAYDDLLGAGVAIPGPSASGRDTKERPAEGESQQKTVPGSAEGSIRLPLERLEGIQNLVGELIINRGGLEQQIGGLREEIEECEAGVGRLERISTWLEDEAGSGLPLGRGATAGQDTAVPDTDDEADEAFDELEFDRYSEIDIMSRHLTEVAADLHTVASDLRGLLRGLQTAVTRERGLSRRLESRVTEARLTSFGSLKPRLERAARVTAARQGKEVLLSLEGLDVEIDKKVLEELAAPFLHLVRNAVDHGIESPAERSAAGKGTTGRIEVRAAYKGRHVVVEIHDDGRGLDAAAICRAAIRTGTVKAAQVATMSEHDLWSLIFVPGLSTARAVDEVSGRGVGMDVVESTVSALGGEIRLDSERGRGTTVTLHVPMSLAVDRVLLARAGERIYAVPQAYVEEVLSLPADGIFPPHSPQGDDVPPEADPPVIRQNGRSLPLCHLSELMDPHTGSLPRDRPTVTAFVVERGGLTQAIAVDALLGSREVVVKPLLGDLREVRGVVGATILGDGSLVLILNPPELMAAREAPLVDVARRAAAAREIQEIRTVLIVDDSLSIRRSMTASVEDAGWRAVTARDGQEAFEILQQATRPPSVIVLDIEMPRMDGFELTATLRAIEAYAGIPIIILTSRAGEKHRQRALELGATDYMVKPYQEEILIRTIHDVVQSAGT